MKFYESHTAYEWAMQVAANGVEPFGEERDDRRGSIHTANMMASNSIGEGPNPVQFREWLAKLRDYLPTAEDYDKAMEEAVAAEALKAMKRGE